MARLKALDNDLQYREILSFRQPRLTSIHGSVKSNL